MGQNKKKRYAILCSGGSAPGMATCVISFVKKCLSCGVEPVAIYDGYEGLHNDKFKTLSNNIVFNYIDNGSALIGTSRCPKFKEDSEYRKKCAQNIFKNKIDGLVVVGGEGSYKGALELSRLGVNVMTIPATIDNDVPSSTYTIGFDTCLNTVCREVGDVNDVFASHKGVGIIEVMGRGCPDVTIRSAIACNATYMVTKFSKLKPDGFLKIVQDGFAKGKSNVTFIVTEQLYPESGKNSLSSIAKWIEKETGIFIRHVVLGYVQRGGKPSARDKLLANYMSSLAVDQLLAGKTNKAICRRARETVAIDLSAAHKMRRKSYNRILVSVFNKINQE